MFKIFTISIPILFMLFGCSVFSGYEKDIVVYQDNVYNKKCDIKSIKNTKNDLFFLNQAGSLARFCKDYKLSNEIFDKSENKYKDVDLKGFFNSLAQNSASALTNENAKRYDGTFYERVMINIYKALNFLSLQDYAGARVEFNRALQRQIIAKEHFAKEINKAKIQLQNEISRQNINQKDVDKFINNYDETISNFTIYPDFVNPFVTYLSAIFFYSQKDYAKSEDLFKENLRMDPNNAQIKADLITASKAANSSHGTNNSYIWLIYEAGNSIGLREEQYSLPIVLGENLYNAAFALPKLTSSISSFSALSINGIKSIKIADMDSVIAKEFKITYPLKFTSALTSALSKVTLQAGAAQVNDIGYVLAHIYTAVTNRADIRYLSSLPSNFQSARVQNRGQDIIINDDFGNELANFRFENGKNGIIYVKSLNKQSIFIDKIEL